MFLTPYRLIGTKNVTAVKMIPRVNMLDQEPLLYWAYIRDGNMYVAYSHWTMYNRREEIAAFGPAQDCAIAFNGYWERDAISKRFFFVAEEYPWVFRLNDGILTVRRTDADPFQLGENVEKVDAVRGWIPAQAGHTQDQGLIVAYLKSGVAYYRNYCLQSDGTTYLWESEQQITELPTGLTDIALFRTNDFRVGVLGRDSSGNLHMTVTIRNWAGMSLWPEHVTADITATAELIPLTFSEAFGEEHVAAKIINYIDYCPVGYDAGGLIESRKRATDTSIEIEFKYPLLSHEGYQELFTLTGTDAPGITGIIQGSSDNKMILLLDGVMDTSIDYSLAYTNPQIYEKGIRVNVDNACQPLVESFSFDLLGTPPEGYTIEHVSASMSGTAVLKVLTFTSGQNRDEHITADISGTATLWKVEDAPV